MTEPEKKAVGIPAVLHSMGPALRDLGPIRTAKLMTAMNQKDGFDCMSCAWPDPSHRSPMEFCENGFKAVTWEATPITIPTSFWAENSLTSLADQDEYWLGQQGRLVEPVHKPAGSDHYVPIGWAEAFTLIAERLNALDSPDQASFYTSGRTANETAFLYQLFVRAFGTNNLPDCSNMCHESTGTAMGETLGVGKSTIAYEDFGQADLIIVMGQNPGTNHPRMLTALEECKRNGGQIVAVNPLPEAGLQRYKNPQKIRGIVGRGTDLADVLLQIRSSGDMALLQAVCKRVLDADEAAAGTRPRPRIPGRAHGRPRGSAHASGRSRRAGRSRRHRSDHRADRRPGGPLHRRRPRHHHVGHGPDPAAQGGRHDQGDREPAAAARKHREAWRRSLTDPRALQRAGRPDHGHLGADVRRVPRRPGRRVRLRPSPRARLRLRPDPSGPAARRHLGVPRVGRQLRGRHLRHGGRRSRPARCRPDGADLHQAESLSRHHRRRGHHLADPRAHRDRPAGRQRTVPVRRGLGVRRARHARADSARGAEPAQRGRDRRRARPSHSGRPVRHRLAGHDRRLRPDPYPCQPGGAGLRVVQHRRAT